MALPIPPYLLPVLSLPPSTYCRSYFTLLTAGILALQLLPTLQDALLNYGPRNSPQVTTAPPVPAPKPPTTRIGSRLVSLLRKMGLLVQVPHSWFSHFYLALLAFQAFWAAQYLTGGGILSALAEREVERGGGRVGMSPGQVVLAWGMLTAQGARRLYECWAVMRPSSSSQMLGIHWVLSVLVYLAMSISIWVEGSASVLDGSHLRADSTVLTPLRTAALGLFLAASVLQHRAHAHLASLRKYTLPHEGLFRHVVCPHYTCECLIYVALATAAAPAGHLFNRTLLSGLFFVAANLGATAGNTRAWYAEKFGESKVPRWRMIPCVF